MKKLLFLLTAAALFAVSCTDKGGGSESPSVYFKSFGFYKADNPALDKDYVASGNLKSASEIEVILPNDIDPAVFAELAPRFEVNAENVIVKVGDDILLPADQKPADSGAAGAPASRGDGDGSSDEPGPEEASYIYSLDLRKPVELILSDGKLYKNYLLSAGIQTPWKKVAEGSAAIFGGAIKPAYDSKGDQFYLAGALIAENSAERYPVLYSFKNGAISPAVGSDGVIAQRQSAGCNNVAVASDGTPYVAFTDYVVLSEGASATARVSVASVKNGAASIVGSAGAIYAANTSYEIEVFPFAANKVWAAMTNNANVTTAPALNRRLLNLASFDGSAWTNAVAIAGRSATDYGYFPRSVFNGSKGWLFLANQNVGTYSVYKNEGTDWSAVAESVFPIDKDGTALAKAAVSYYGGLGVDASGNAYIIGHGKLDGSNWACSLQKIGANGALSFVGGIIPGTESSNGSVKAHVAFAADGTPYVSFQSRGGSQQPMVSRLDAASGSWITEAISPVKVGDEVIIASDKNGKLFIFAVEDDTDHVVVWAL
ncbi:MAG: hypothetical protein IJV01_03375 [Bacteroidales bacterium]|nr:hypothetical protein [Bacteroidales bacterium]